MAGNIFVSLFWFSRCSHVHIFNVHLNEMEPSSFVARTYGFIPSVSIDISVRHGFNAIRVIQSIQCRNSHDFNVCMDMVLRSNIVCRQHTVGASNAMFVIGVNTGSTTSPRAFVNNSTE